MHFQLLKSSMLSGTKHRPNLGLNPRQKFDHFCKYWGQDLLKDIEKTVQKKFIEHYEKMQTTAWVSRSVNVKNTKNLTCRNCDDMTDSESDSDSELVDPAKPWLNEWNMYKTTRESVPDDMNIVKWWGASLARDYLVIIASSVSSEHAFSSAGITISKRRSRLKSDIVEAIECLKCLIHKDLLFREVVLVKSLEMELKNNDQVLESQDYLEVVKDSDGFSWDQLLEEGEDDIGETMVEILD
ncbi:hypothetical protein CVT26_002952 [Gymnopilus dilepis]|uniref:HAT C-terminal dimerisation domain-containing protein n=1 Tax=Gymnopilus dilepis TaxID=231916 RepID=A0A409Y4M4_9AGAR|nr:hypothetical protein CVT26_002952 [Gymnopilus dilepis]